LYSLNLYCVQRDITEQALKPARATVVIGWIGVVLMVIALAVTIYTKM
jgi:hypothetical protein